ncbi:hypothetical protein KDN24_06475 [Bacillus sp. Bva_UNVM-123]|uniref:hypothetical protein n=1 Tax=Bacillus sp. Bva_UNVM-123 TaxID=2829798 RepID=UPI00391EF7A4
MLFKVDTDQDFYEKLKALEFKLGSISATFQNPDTKLSPDEFGNWNQHINEFKKEMNKLFKEASNRITLSKD